MALRFGIPPSLGMTEAEARAQKLADYFKGHGESQVTVRVSPSYEQLARDVLSGNLDAAWAPPFVCARLEAMGASVRARGVRHGGATYRAALLCRPETPFDVGNLFSVRAVWNDQDSVGGYLLPIAWLRGLKVETATAFKSQAFVGSYREAVEEVLLGRADLTSVFAPLHDTLAGLDEFLPHSRERFKVVGVTAEAPNDGVVFSPLSKPSVIEGVEKKFLALHESAEGLGVLKDVFAADRFEPAPRMGYRALYPIAFGRG